MLEALCLLLLTSCLGIAEDGLEAPAPEDPDPATHVVAAAPESSDDPSVSEDR